MVNQKFYTVFWFWLSFLMVVSSFMLTVRVILICSPEAREAMLKYFHGIKHYRVSEISL